MIDYDVLEDYGTTDARMAAVFTADSETKLNGYGEALWNEQYEPEPAEEGEEPKKPEITKEELAKELCAARKEWEDRIGVRIQNGRDLSMRNYRHFMAADMAFDSTPISPAKYAHMLYANGDLKLDFQELYTEVKKGGR
jgi:hypothetical protein